MKKFAMIVAMAAMVLVADSQLASAGRRGGRGGCGGGSCGGGYSMGGCGMGGCGMGGYNMGGCASGNCGMGGFGGYAGCQTCGGGYAMGAGNYGTASCATCAGGVCTINPLGTAIAQTDASQATMVVKLPADATLTIDNEPTTSTTGNRVFVSPSLEAGKEYQYSLKARVVRDGKVQTTTAQVTVRPGEVSNVELTIPATSVAAQ